VSDKQSMSKFATKADYQKAMAAYHATTCICATCEDRKTRITELEAEIQLLKELANAFLNMYGSVPEELQLPTEKALREALKEHS